MPAQQAQVQVHLHLTPTMQQVQVHVQFSPLPCAGMPITYGIALPKAPPPTMVEALSVFGMNNHGVQQ